MKLNAFLAAVRRYWKTFAAVATVVFAAALALILLAPAKFVSTTQLMVSISGSTTAAAYQNDDVVAGRVNSYIALLTSDVVSQRVIDKLGLSMTAPELAAKISATNVPPKTSVIDVAVTDDSPERARLLADTLAGEFVSYTTALETPTGEDSQKVRTTVVSGASEPRERRAERVALGALAALAALLLGAVAVWIRSLLDPVVRTAERAAAEAGVPVLGCVTEAPAASLEDLENYRRLRTRLRAVIDPAVDGVRGLVLVLTCPVGDVDTATIAFNLGRVMELAGGRASVVDSVAPVAVGPAHDSVEADEGPRQTAGFPDRLSMSGWADAPDLAAGDSAASLFDRLRNDYSHVLVAAPPAQTTSTASVVSEYADGVILVVVPGRTTRRDLRQTADNLRATGAPLIGVVLVDGAQSRPVDPDNEVDHEQVDESTRAS